MKPVAVLVALNALCLATGAALPSVVDTSSANLGVFAKRDDEWVMVLYNEHKKGGQCGGTSRAVTGNGDECVDVKDSKCADLKAGVSIASVSFSWKRDSCSGNQAQYNVVQGGTDSNGVDLTDDVRFVQITGSDGGYTLRESNVTFVDVIKSAKLNG